MTLGGQHRRRDRQGNDHQREGSTRHEVSRRLRRIRRALGSGRVIRQCAEQYITAAQTDVTQHAFVQLVQQPAPARRTPPAAQPCQHGCNRAGTFITAVFSQSPGGHDISPQGGIGHHRGINNQTFCERKVISGEEKRRGPGVRSGAPRRSDEPPALGDLEAVVLPIGRDLAVTQFLGLGTDVIVEHQNDVAVVVVV
jgi:hypothetical protein